MSRRLNNISYCSFNLNDISFDTRFLLYIRYEKGLYASNDDNDVYKLIFRDEEQKKKLNKIDNHYINFPMSYLKGDMIHLTLDNMTGILPKKTFES